MELVLFIIVAVFLWAKIVSDNTSVSQAKSGFRKEQDAKEQDNERWRASVTDKSTEIELQDFIYDNTRPRSKKKCDIGTVGWMSPELKDRLSDIPQYVLDYCIYEDRILLVMMVKMGKLPWKVADWGIDCAGANYNTLERRRFQRQHEFLMWVDEELQKHGIEPMLFKKSSEPLQKRDFAKDVSEYKNGKYCWWSGRRFA